MLGKLIKHEFKATAMIFLFLYSALIALTLINKAVWFADVDNVVMSFIKGVVTFAYVVSIIAAAVVTIIFIIYRFYKNLISDEGYLSFTLPVKVSQHILSKLTAGFVWSVGTMLVIILSLVIMSAGTEFYSDFAQLWKQLSFVMLIYEGIPQMIVEVIALMIIGSISSILMFYACLSIGQLFAKHKIAGAVLSYFGFYVILQIINTIVMSISMLGDSSFFRIAMTETDISANTAIHLFNGIFLWIIILQIIMTVVYYFVTRLILSKRLNLE